MLANWQVKQTKAAILTTFAAYIKAMKPEKRTYMTAKDTPDHWGLTEKSINRQVNNMKNAGFNEAIDAMTAALLSGLEGEK